MNGQASILSLLFRAQSIRPESKANKVGSQAAK